MPKPTTKPKASPRQKRANINTIANWRYENGKILGPERPHSDKPYPQEMRTPSTIVAMIGNAESTNFLHYPKDVADRHGRLIALLPTIITKLGLVQTYLEDGAPHSALRVAQETIAITGVDLRTEGD